MTDQKLSPVIRNRYTPDSLSGNFSDEEMARDWTLSAEDLNELGKYRKDYRLFIAAQLCAVRLHGRFFSNIQDLSPLIVNYLARQLDLPPTIDIEIPERKATRLKQRQSILKFLGFRKFDATVQEDLVSWLESQSGFGELPITLLGQAENFLLSERIMLPGSSVLERLVNQVCLTTHNELFEQVTQQISPQLRKEIERLLTVSDENQRSYFHQLKESPPSAKISSLRRFLALYRMLLDSGIDRFKDEMLNPAFRDYLYQLARRYNATDLKRFNSSKRNAMMICFLLETRRIMLDNLVRMHDQYMMNISRLARNTHEKKHRQFRKRQKKAIDVMLNTVHLLLEWPDDQAFDIGELWQHTDKDTLKSCAGDLQIFKRMEERGFGDLLLTRYSSLRRYFPEFLKLPFAAEPGSEDLLEAINLVRRLDAGELKQLPDDAPTGFIPRELRRALKSKSGKLNRNAWEMGLALAIKDALRSRNLYLPESKHHVSFWNLIINERLWDDVRFASYEELGQVKQDEVKAVLSTQFRESLSSAEERFPADNFAAILDGRLQLKRDDKIVLPLSIANLQKTIDASMPQIRIEQLLIAVDRLTGFSRHFTPVQQHKARPKNFYKTLIAALISQATNLGIMAMSASVKDVSVDMLRHVLHFYIREDTLKAASAEIVNHHHQLPLSSVHGSGTISSSDAQRFKIRADSLLASYYPRYFGYYEKAIGIYTHVSDQYSVFNTKVISCSPREALYVLDGLLENNTILQIQKHTTDTAGYTEILFALSYLLGYYFMPRIRDLKDQQLYRIEKDPPDNVFAPLLTRTVDMNVIEEQWDAMIRVATSLKKRTAPAHVIMQRLTRSYPADRLSKAFTNLGRIIKTKYILRYLTDIELRRTVQRQLNKGEYRHKLSRWIFFADQGEFSTGDYEEIMNKASCLSLVSNAILYWNTIRINDIVEGLKHRGEVIDEEALSHISLLPFKHVLPNGTYFIEDL